MSSLIPYYQYSTEAVWWHNTFE